MAISSTKLIRSFLMGAVVLSIAACSSAPDKPQPAPLPVLKGELKIKQVWTANVGAVTSPLFAAVLGEQLAVASTAGQVALLDARTGQDIWRLKLNDVLQAGVGSDGKRFAVITQTNEVVSIEAGKVIWRYRLPALSYTAPLVAGGRVFVLTADRTVTALDGASGQKLWVQQRSGDPLVLKQAGLLMPFGDTLLAGWGGRLVSLNPNNGAVRWETLVGSSRGTNEVERLVDLVGPANRLGNSVCVRAFQATVSCLDASRGTSVWSRSAQGHEGLDGDETLLFGTESDSKVIAWDRQGGKPTWTQDSLRFRGLTAPLVSGSSVVVGDDNGLVHFLSRQNGQAQLRLSTDGSPIVAKPVAAGQTLVVMTRNGGVFGFRPE